MLNLILLLVMTPVVMTALVDSMMCGYFDPSSLRLARSIIDVALDRDEKVLKFFFNTKVLAENMTITDPVITDVNSTTNRFTTFHAMVWFMGEPIVDELKRFCDMVGVKNTTEFLSSPRFDTETQDLAQASATLPPDSTKGNGIQQRDHIDLWHAFEARQVRGFADEDEEDRNNRDLMAFSNTTIEKLFDNSTGDLVQCPLYVNDSIYMYYQVDVSEHMGKLGLYSARFSVISNNDNSAILSCDRVYVTPAINIRVQKGILMGGVFLILVTGLTNFLTVIHSSYQESQNPFLFFASAICNTELLKQMEATVQRTIMYLQFALFTAGLNISYPGFYQPMLALLKWCALLGFTFLSGNKFYKSTEQDNIYLTYNASGLSSLSYFGDYRTSGDNWWNFILLLIVCIGVQIAFQSGYLFMEYMRNRKGKKLLGAKSLQTTCCRWASFLLGIFLNNFMLLFGYPFLVLTLYLYYLAGQDQANMYPNVQDLGKGVFKTNISYDSLFLPRHFSGTPFNHTHHGLFPHHMNHTGFGFNGTLPQWSHKGVNFKGIATAPLIFSGILLALWIGIGLYFVFRYLITFKKWRITSNPRVTKLYTSVNTLLIWASSYHHYDPNKNYYVIVDYVQLFLKLAVIALVQESGMAQVICLIVLEFLSVVLLLTVSPFYLKLTLTTTRWMVPVARTLITILCIPFIPDLNYSETIRSLVAYVHLSIHSFIGLVFICQLFYCLATTIYMVIKNKGRNQNMPTTQELGKSSSLEDFNQQFEYLPVDSRMKTNDHEPEEDDVEDVYSFEGVQNDYYRHKASLVGNQIGRKINSTPQYIHKSDSFESLQEHSTKRRQNMDYTTREADQIYKKYFVDENMDEDVKQLWEARQKRQMNANDEKAASEDTTKEKGIFHWFHFKAKEESVKGFQVSRPKQLVVKSPVKTPISLSDYTSSTATSALNHDQQP